MDLENTMAYFASLPNVVSTKAGPFKFKSPSSDHLYSIDYVPHQQRRVTDVKITLLGVQAIRLDEVIATIFEDVWQRHKVSRFGFPYDANRGFCKTVVVPADADTLHETATEFLNLIHSDRYRTLRAEYDARKQELVKALVEAVKQQK